MSYHSRGFLTPGAPRKRKERETPYSSTSSPQSTVSSNRLLAGYMAHEFLTKGTLLGQKFDPARAEAVPLPGGSAESKRGNPEVEPSIKRTEQKSYSEVASILKTEEAHIPGILNPSQLARWIQTWGCARGEI